MKVIYTKHARERIKKRDLNLTSIEQMVTNPDRKVRAKDGQWKFIKQQGSRLYQVVARELPDERAWLIVSAWVRGEDDKSDLLWQMIVAPFKLVRWLIKLIFGW